ncbi:Minor histocompatibility antigen H13 [Zancudomyces culisetae]|uniref:Minor histocompatibility antigen H13 n=1 Tax=Zancudomyces culisetae TaxID=1213189 RepID=A0A1R1PS18_ZANCU|nr:Minor histocompatibility antigen H13 [Zancudomyces culisetae]|eukprot:OMH83748.1 Minor histocompatibility antigen H13 [Zancudomyces culisetae]
MSSGLYVAYGAIASMALLPIYYGSFNSITKLKGPERKKTKFFQEYSDSEDSDDEEAEGLTTQDAYMYPVYGSATLLSLYLVLKYFNVDYVNMLMTVYFSVAGIGALAHTLVTIAKGTTNIKLPLYYLSLVHKQKEQFLIKFTKLHLITLGLSTVLTGLYFLLEKNWILSNLIGLAFSFGAIKLMKLESFKTGIIMLMGLFFYDIFWVFGTEVMVSVAKNLDAPIKLLFPKDILNTPGIFGLKPIKSFVMLGLGDIVIPGIYIALCLRFDRSQYLKKVGYVPKQPLPSVLKGKSKGFKFETPYFNTCFVAYIFGLITTVFVMHTFKAAQPALLYLSPACTLSTIILAAARGELSDFFAYTEEFLPEEGKTVSPNPQKSSRTNNKDDLDVNEKYSSVKANSSKKSRKDE